MSHCAYTFMFVFRISAAHCSSDCIQMITRITLHIFQETEAKRRVLEQIKRDREAKKTVVEQRQTSETSKPKSFSLGNTSDSPYCCLQIRLPDGTTMKERFKVIPTIPTSDFAICHLIRLASRNFAPHLSIYFC